MRTRRAPRRCPVCAEDLAVIRLGCQECGSELSGAFESCEFCALTDEDRELLHVFLTSRGNMKELERHLGVSYPTARARYDDLLGRLRLQPRERQSTQDVLEALACGEIDVDEASKLIG